MAYKRVLDLLVGSLLMVVFLPVGLLLALLIRLETDGPVFFVQMRSGKDEKPFQLYKFRSMVVNDIDPSELGPVKHNHVLVTRVGHFMRRTKLDEIPQLFNVLRGELSLVGPRPCLLTQVHSMTLTHRRRFNVPAGMTGWAEVNGNVELSLSEQLALDVWYVDHHSIWLDVQILIETLGVMIFGPRRNERAIQQAHLHRQLTAYDSYTQS